MKQAEEHLSPPARAIFHNPKCSTIEATKARPWPSALGCLPAGTSSRTVSGPGHWHPQVGRVGRGACDGTPFLLILLMRLILVMLIILTILLVLAILPAVSLSTKPCYQYEYSYV